MSFPGDNKSSPQTSQIQPLLYPNPVPQPYTDVQGFPQPVLLPVHERKKKSFGRRVLRGLLFIFVFFSLVNVTHRLFGRHWFWRHRDFGMDPNDYYYDIPSDLVLENCIEGADWSVGSDDGPFLTATTTFEIPLSADNIFLISRGRFSGGFVRVATSSDQAKDSVTFDVVAKYRREEERDLAKACLTSRDGNQQGVGIFTPTWRYNDPHRHGHSMHFEIAVTLPEDSSPISIKGFETDVPNISQFLASLGSKIDFESFSLKGTNAPIYVESLSTIQGKVHTTNSGIHGTFNSTSSLILETTNGPINVAVGLHDEGNQPTLIAHTTNGQLNARLSLSTPSGEGGKFTVDTTTTNVGLDVTFVNAPLDSVLQHHARTTNGKVTVTLHETYEGEFQAATSRWFKADVKFFPATDPSGKERKRVTSVQSDRNYFSGNTKWMDTKNPDHGKKTGSNVVLSTTNSPITLNLLGI